ncbi:hypothetical protein [Campylobacter jejuni]|uniref:hypothetical protein n=1 Tax=Campylobacter jejuni TaxID=197 RepID=UPI0002E07514|nr:hypothetical protein [Campylobacter jejuni]
MLQGSFRIALKDRYIQIHPKDKLKDKSAKPKRFQNNHNIDKKYPALIQTEEIKRIYSRSKAR